MKALVAAIAFMLLAVPARAQRFEVAPLTIGSHATSSSIDQEARGVRDLKIDGGFAWTAQAAYFFNRATGVEVWWRRQNTSMSMTMASGSDPVTLFYMQTNDLDANIVYQLPTRFGVVPFVSGGIGMTFLSADTLDSETRLAWNAGGGVKWFPLRHVGLRFDVRYRVTRLDTSAADYCAPFGFCQASLNTMLVGAGAQFRF